MATSFDLITMGRIGVDIYPLQIGVPLARVETFGKFLGGSATNVAVAAARLGRDTAVISRTGKDPFGEYVHQALAEFGVDDRFVTPVAEYPTPVTFCEIFPPDDFPLYFYRRPKAPDLVIHPEELDLDAIRGAGVFWVTGTGLSEEPSRTATLAALEARSRAGPTVFDLDWRPTFWDAEGGDDGGAGGAAVGGGGAGGGGAYGGGGAGGAYGGGGAGGAYGGGGAGGAYGGGGAYGAYGGGGAGGGGAGGGVGGGEGGGAGRAAAIAKARPYYVEALRHATVAVGNVDECEVATGVREPRACAAALLAAGVELAVVKQGPKGVLAVHRDGTEAELPPIPVEVVNGLGAGDAFGGSLCHGLLARWDLARVMRYANAAGAIVASRLACSSAMPTESEVEDLLACR